MDQSYRWAIKRPSFAAVDLLLLLIIVDQLVCLSNLRHQLTRLRRSAVSVS